MELNSKRKLKFSLLILGLVPSLAYCAFNQQNLRYGTSFGKCPSRVAGSFTMNVFKTFEKTTSLKDVKVKIFKDELAEKHFLSSYEIDFDPFAKKLFVQVDCPEPLMKVQIYKDSGLESYEAILVEGGKLVDPTYEVVLRRESKLKYDLPFLALPVGKVDQSVQKEIASVVGPLGIEFRKKVSEMIVGEGHELTMILSINGRPSSVFIGEDLWSEKIDKLTRLISFMELNKRKIPSVINLTNPKKVVVKFN